MHNNAAMTPAPPVAAPILSARQVGLILFALAMGGFAIGTSEFVVMGLITQIARGLGVTEPQVGHVISAYALGVVVGAPVLAILGSRLSRRSLLLALMGFYAVGNLASALAPGYSSLMLARFVAGLPHGAYFGIAALVAARISPPEQRGAAVGRVMLGLSIALLVGNPLATWLGQAVGWRWAFALVSVIALATVAMTLRVLPRGMNAPRPDVLRELRDFNRKPVWLALGIGAIGFAGMFAVFSYLAPTLVHVTGVRESFVPFGLVAFGIGGILGTLGGGWLFDRLQFRAAAVVLVWSALVLLLFPLAARSAWTVLPAVLLVGTMGALGDDPAGAPDGRGRRSPDAGGRLQPFRLQHRQRARPLARRHGDHRGLRLDFDGRGGCDHRCRWSAGVRVGAPGCAPPAARERMRVN